MSQCAVTGIGSGLGNRCIIGVGFLSVLLIGCATAPSATQDATSAASALREQQPPTQTVEDRNTRLTELAASPAVQQAPSSNDYRIGPDDLLDIAVFDAPELSRSARVSGDGEISLPLLGAVQAAGLTPSGLESSLEDLLRKDYMVDPDVTVTVTEMQSHAVSVVGAVNKPGVVQVRGSKTLLEVLALAEGLADDAGESVVVMRADLSYDAPLGTNGNPTESSVVDLAALLETGEPGYNLAVFPGDIVKVQRAGVIYVVGEVNRPGSFPMRQRDDITVLRALALGEGLMSTASKSGAVIIRTDADGSQTEMPIDLGDILAARVPDPVLQSEDILFVPNSASKSLARGLANAFMRMITLRAVF